MKNIFLKLLLVGVVSTTLYSCSKEPELGPTIFDTNDTLDPNSATYAFDQWINAEFLVPYNIDFRYKMQDVGSEMTYNLVPATLTKSKEMAQLLKYLWFDVYAQVGGADFIKNNAPRIIHLIGSPAYNPVSQTMTLGTAEGGIKVTLYRCNDMDPTNVPELNEFYFKVIHHEFMHILHQKKSYPIEFGQLSKGNFNPLGWQSRTDSQAASLGFVSPYGGSQEREDFVEVIANYLVKSDEDWNRILEMASEPGLDIYGKLLPDDGVDGKALILQKVKIASNWFKVAWGIDLDLLRAEIMLREQNIDTILK
jgi:substrate import-associated zinc metallohydrolase lipoprotein